MKLVKFIRRDLNDKRPIFGSSNEPPVDRSILDYPLALISAPFELLDALRPKKAHQRGAKHSPEPIAQAPTPRKPTIAELKAKLDWDLRDADLLPVSDEEKTEIKARIELGFFKKMEQYVDGTM